MVSSECDRRYRSVHEGQTYCRNIGSSIQSRKPAHHCLCVQPLLAATNGTRTRIAEVLSRKRALSIAMIRRLHDKLGIPAEVLIRPTRKNEAT
jgi:hypothetical protein